MKRVLQTVRKLSLLAAGIVLLSVSSNAADVNVVPGFNTLSDAIAASPGSTFILERGGVYIIDYDIVIDVPTTIMAADGDQALAPPVIQYYANPGEATYKKFFLVGASTTFKGLGFHGFTPGNEAVRQSIIICTAADITVVLDGCVMQAARQILDFGGKNNNTYILKNNIFFNLCNVGWDNWGGFGCQWGGNGCDYQAYNNTYFMAGRIFNGGALEGTSSEMMNHNSYVNTWGDVFYPSWSQDYVATNNIFYNAQMRGYYGLRLDAAGDTIWEGDFRDWEYDTLVGDISIFPHLNDSLDNSGPRKVSITNNMKMYDQTCMDFYTENGFSPMTLWNKTSRDYFGPRYGWEYKDNYLQEDGNEIDPQFAMGDLPAGTYEYAFLTRMERHLPVEQQGADFPYKIVWLPNDATMAGFIWPLPFDFKPTNKELWHLGDDGYPLGDLNWFGDDVVAAWEAGEDNTLPTAVDKFQLEGLQLKTYPNPFSSSSMISYSLPSDGKVSISVYNVSGAKVAQLVNEHQSIGQHEVVFDAADLSSGIYFCKVQMGSYTQVEKMSVVK